jgi:GntR family transcriptional regulator
LDLIEKLGPGEPLPAERQLAAQLHVARMTLRRAIDVLVESGDLVRLAGRGTFVAKTRFITPSRRSSFRDEMERHGMVASSRTIEFSVQDAGARLARKLYLSPADQVVCARRLRLADDEAVALERIHVPAAMVPGLTADDLEKGSLYELLASRYGIEIGPSASLIRVTSVNGAEAELLNVPAHSPAFYIQSTRRSPEGVIVEYLEAIYRGDRYRFSIDDTTQGVEPEFTAPAAQRGPDALHGE